MPFEVASMSKPYRAATGERTQSWNAQRSKHSEIAMKRATNGEACAPLPSAVPYTERFRRRVIRSELSQAWLSSDLITRRRNLSVYGTADGSGAHASPLVARFMAISECLERWAFHDCVRSPVAARYGFDIDATSNGMAAFPGLFPKSARRASLFEAIERASLFDWWEGRCGGQMRTTPWSDIQAIQIANPLGIGVTVVTFSEFEPGRFAYGHAAGPDFISAAERAKGEMERSALVLRFHQIAVAAGRGEPPTDRFERRCVFFATPDGHAVFRERIARGANAAPLPWSIACDREIVGPWSRYAAVWRVLIPRPTEAFLGADENYFFW